MSAISTLIESFDTENTIEEAHFPFISEALDSTDEEQCVKVLTFIGDLNRQEPNRNMIGSQTSIIEKMVSKLNHSSPLVIQFAARALGNLSYQDEKNRNSLVELGVPSKLVEILKSTDDPAVQKNVTGALANVSFVSDSLQVNLVQQDIIPLLSKQLLSSEELVVVMTIRAIGNIFDETTCKSFFESDCLENILSLIITNDSALVRSDALTTLGTFTEDNEDELIRFAENGDNIHKIHLVAKNDSDEQVRNDAWGFLITLAQNEKIKPIFVEKDILTQLLVDAEQLTDADPLSSTLQLLGYLAAYDNCMDTIFNRFSVFITLAQHEDMNVKTYTAMILGNISRKDDYCVRLVQAGAVAILKDLCSDDVRVQHLALGALRNIAIPDVNKETVLNQEGLLEAVNKCIAESNNAHVLFNSVLLMKILCAGGTSFVDKLIQSNLLDNIQILLDRTLDEGQERIHFEASRLLVLIANASESSLNLVMEKNLMLKGLALLLSTSFGLLHTEALSVLSTLVKQEDAKQQIVESGMVSELLRILPTSDVDLQVAILQVLNQLKENPKAKQTIVESSQILSS